MKNKKDFFEDKIYLIFLGIAIISLILPWAKIPILGGIAAINSWQGLVGFFILLAIGGLYFYKPKYSYISSLSFVGGVTLYVIYTLLKTAFTSIDIGIFGELSPLLFIGIGLYIFIVGGVGISIRALIKLRKEKNRLFMYAIAGTIIIFLAVTLFMSPSNNSTEKEQNFKPDFGLEPDLDESQPEEDFLTTDLPLEEIEISCFTEENKANKKIETTYMYIKGVLKDSVTIEDNSILPDEVRSSNTMEGNVKIDIKTYTEPDEDSFMGFYKTGEVVGQINGKLSEIAELEKQRAYDFGEDIEFLYKIELTKDKINEEKISYIGEMDNEDYGYKYVMAPVALDVTYTHTDGTEYRDIYKLFSGQFITSCPIILNSN